VREAERRDRNKVEFLNRIASVIAGLIIFSTLNSKKPFYSKAFSYPATLDALNFPN
jgi:hypothetical protein